ncbi:MAG: TlpA family protein disulfide reductase [Vulcanimicrobiaceae bacterium]
MPLIETPAGGGVRGFRHWGRVLDALALVVLCFVAWKWFVAPRTLATKPVRPAPHVVYPLMRGGEFALAKARGHVVFLDFWASWCYPCKVELPLVEHFARNHPPGVSVVEVDVGEPASVAAAYASAHGLTHVAFDPATISQGYFQLSGFPTMVVIGPRGNIRATWRGLNPAIDLAMAHAVRKLSR